MDIFKVAGTAIVTVILTVTVKSIKPELGLQVALAGGAVLLLLLISELSGIVGALKGVFSGFVTDLETVQRVIKVVGIAYVGQIAADICRDSGETALASKTEICARVLIASAALPTLVKLLKLLTALIEKYL